MKLDGTAMRNEVSKSSVSVWVRDIRPPPPPPPSRGAPVVEGAGKVCGQCRRELTLASFNRDGDGRQYWCRECFQEYFRTRGQVHRDQTKRAKNARIAPAQQLVREHLTRSCCVDCGEDEIVVLEFDHVGVKRDPVATLMWHGASLESLREEMKLCEVVCACCHRRRTARRGGSWRDALDWVSSDDVP